LFSSIRGKLYPAVCFDTTEKEVAVSATFWDGKTDPKDMFVYKGAWGAPTSTGVAVPKWVDAIDDDDESPPGTLTPSNPSNGDY
jgi:hypothetical protein